MHFNVFYRFAFYIAWKSAWSFPTTHSKLFKRIKRNRLIYFSHPLLISEGSRGTAALGGLEICHGFQQPFTTPLAAHQDGSNQGRWYNHATLSKVDLKAAFPCPWQRERALLVFRGAFCSPDPTTAPGISQLGELALHSRSNEFQSCALRRQVSQRRFFTITNLCRLLGLHHFQGRNEIRRRPGQWASLAPPRSNLRSFGSKRTVLKKVFVTFLKLFGAQCSDSAQPAVIRRPGNCAPFAPLVTLLTLLVITQDSWPQVRIGAKTGLRTDSIAVVEGFQAHVIVGALPNRMSISLFRLPSLVNTTRGTWTSRPTVVYFCLVMGVGKGGRLGLNPPLELDILQNFLTCAKDIVFAYFLLVNLST